MGSSSVFGNAQVTVLETFLEKVPPSIDKAQFFEESLKDLKCLVSQDGSSYTLEGYWKSILEAQDFLTSQLEKWSSVKQDILTTARNIEAEYLTVQETVTVDSLCEDSVVGDDVDAPETSPAEDILLNESDAVQLLSLSLSKQDSKPEDLLAIASEGYIGITNNEKEKQAENQEVCYSKSQTELCMESHVGATEEIDLHSNQGAEPQVENEVYLDIQLEHNYNYLEKKENCETYLEDVEPSIENEIYMDIKLSNADDKIFTNDLPVTLVVSKEDEPGIEVLQFNVNKKDLTSENQEQLRQRRKKYEEQAPFRYFCNQCSFKTKRHSHMRKHARFHEKVCTIFSCDQCDFSTIRASHLHRHIGTHKTEIFACFECNYSTHTEALLTKHQRTKHIAKKSIELTAKDMYQCLHCSYMTTSEKLMQRHMAVHKNKNGTHTKKKRAPTTCFKCDHCSYQTPSRSNFYRHMGTVHGEHRPYLCKTCGLRYKRADTLLQHEATHGRPDSEAVSYQCPRCQKFYRSQSDLQQHQLTHGEERRYLCEVCAASFKTRASQRKHYLEKHVQEKKHSCPVCSKRFQTRYLVKRHMKCHPFWEGKIDPTETSSKSQQVIPSSEQWENTLITIPTSQNDVQVLLVHQEPPQSELTVHDSSLYPVPEDFKPGEEISVPVLPEEYVVPASNQNDVGMSVNVLNSGTNNLGSEGELITLTFVQEDSPSIQQTSSLQ